MDTRHIFIALLTAATAAAPACAQPDFGQATRETDRATSDAATRKVTNKLRRIPEKISISIDTGPLGTDAPADEQKFYVSKITFTGMRSFAPADFSYITRRYEGRELGSTDMNKLAKEIELEYLKRGVVCVVFVPPQDVTGGEMRVQVMEPDAP